MTVLHTLAWLIAIVYSTIPSYWLLIHPRIDWWRRRRARLALVGPLWFLLWLAMGTVTWRWRSVVFYDEKWMWLPAAALIATGFFVYSRAHHDFSTDQVLGRSELEPERHVQQLNTRGIRGRVRHPYYLGHICELLGWTLGTGLVCLYCMLAFAVLTGAWMIRAEEKELVGRFGDEYREYQQRVPPLWPRL